MANNASKKNITFKSTLASCAVAAVMFAQPAQAASVPSGTIPTDMGNTVQLTNNVISLRIDQLRALNAAPVTIDSVDFEGPTPSPTPPVIPPIPNTPITRITKPDARTVDAVTLQSSGNTHHIDAVTKEQSRGMSVDFNEAISQAGKDDDMMQDTTVAVIDPKGDGLLSYAVSDMTIIEELAPAAGGEAMNKYQTKKIMNKVFNQVIMLDNASNG